MRVAVINTFDARDISFWAGICRYICQMLERMYGNNFKVVTIPPVKRNFLSLARGFWYNRLLKKKYYTWADENIVRNQITSYTKTTTEEFDLIITFQFYLVPFLKTSKNRVIYWNDASFQNLLGFYDGYTNLCSFCLKQGHALQKKAFDVSDAVIFSSDWAIDSAHNYYGCSTSKLNKILFASNLSQVPGEEEISLIIKNRQSDPVIKLLFLGVDWIRKGGQAAVDISENLNKAGYPCDLYIVGTHVPEPYRENNHIISKGFISKNSPEGEAAIIDLIKECHYLVLPTLADCTPVVFSEANSFALPVITNKVGGIPSVIKNHQNGHVFELENLPEQAAEFIISKLPSSEDYKQLGYSSYYFYQREMSWKLVQSKLEGIIASFGINTL